MIILKKLRLKHLGENSTFHIYHKNVLACIYNNKK